MPIKQNISSPLEAGISIFDGRSMPAYLSSALEHTSKRLATKAMHITLVVVRQDCQLPLSTPLSLGLTRPLAPECTVFENPRPSVSTRPRANNPPMHRFSLSSIKKRVRHNLSSSIPAFSTNTSIHERVVDVPDTEQLCNAMVSPALSTSSMSSVASTVWTTSTAESCTDSPCLRWPLTPATPATVYSELSSSMHTVTTDVSIGPCCARTEGLNPIGVKLLHASPLSSKEERMLRQTMQRTERKFHLGPGWFPEAVAPSKCGLDADVIHRSLVQNEVLFSSEGLTLLALDQLYTFKSALSSYEATQAHSKLEDAVDELRRLVLAQGGRRLCKSTLESSFAWLGPLSDSALCDVTRMYRRAYGGISGETGIENDVDRSSPTEDVRAVSYDMPPPASPEPWPLPSRSLQIFDASSDDKPFSELPPTPLASRSPLESGEPPAWQNLEPDSMAASSSSMSSKRFAMINFDFRSGLDFGMEDYCRLSQARDLLGAREDHEVVAWAASGQEEALGEDHDGGPVLSVSEAEEKEDYRTPGQDFMSITLHLDQCNQERATPKIKEKPRLQIQTPPVPSVISKPIALRMPVLKLQTAFDHKPGIQKPVSMVPLNQHLARSGVESTMGIVGMTPIEVRMPGFDRFLAEHQHNKKPFQEEDDEELTARPISGHPSRSHRWTQRWDGLVSNSIDGRLASPVEQQEGHQIGPSTPKGYDDISPTTRGEWGFLFKGDTWQNGRTVAVETC